MYLVLESHEEQSHRSLRLYQPGSQDLRRVECVALHVQNSDPSRFGSRCQLRQGQVSSQVLVAPEELFLGHRTLSIEARTKHCSVPSTYRNPLLLTERMSIASKP